MTNKQTTGKRSTKASSMTGPTAKVPAPQAAGRARPTDKRMQRAVDAMKEVLRNSGH